MKTIFKFSDPDWRREGNISRSWPRPSVIQGAVWRTANFIFGFRIIILRIIALNCLLLPPEVLEIQLKPNPISQVHRQQDIGKIKNEDCNWYWLLEAANRKVNLTLMLLIRLILLFMLMTHHRTDFRVSLMWRFSV